MKWPPALPQEPLLRGLSETAAVEIVEQKMDAGAPKRRPRRGRRRLAMVVDLTRAQATILMNWYDNELRGTGAFDWRHPVSRAPARFVFRTAPRLTPVSQAVFQAALDLEVVR